MKNKIKNEEKNNNTNNIKKTKQKNLCDTTNNLCTRKSVSTNNQSIENNNEHQFNDDDDIVVDFELIDPEEIYKENIHILLKGSELFYNITCFDKLINIICDQQNIGKLISVSNEKDNIISFMTIININQYDEIKNLKEFLINKINKINKINNNNNDINDNNNNNIQEFKNILLNNDKHVGLVITNRIINCPIKLIPLLYENVYEDILWSQQIEDIDPEEKKFYFFDYLLFYTKAYKQNLNDDLIFSNYEEQYFFHKSIHYVMWNNNNIKKFFEIQKDEKKELACKEYLILFLVPMSAVRDVITTISSITK
ncbi:hypothetical protein PFFCH_03046 [Plasmodium falciparum FCH/4]|nr:hypothetical protein PFFCH_03046 [Plasmodium falciparum FCH/4]EWC86774.1 hypothetical protein PFNF54_04327 [Plasmodium falciparum NF54]